MLKSRYFPVIFAFIIVLCGTGYILGPNGRNAVSGAIQQAIHYLPLYLVALVIGLAAALIVSLFTQDKSKDKAFANTALIVFLLMAGFGVFKGGWIHDNSPQWLRQMQGRITAGWSTIADRITGASSTEHERERASTRPEHQPPRRAPEQSTTHPRENNEGQHQVQAWANAISRQLPKRLDQYTQLSSIHYNAPKNTIVMRYDVDEFDSLGVDENQFTDSMQANMLKLYCSGTFFNTVLNHKTSIYAAYHYHYGGVIGHPIELHPAQCR